MKPDPQELRIKKKWVSMHRRVASLRPCDVRVYGDVTIDPRWDTLEGFREWFLAQPGHEDVWAIDKDLLVRGNRVYGPDTCALIPGWINNAIATRPRGALPRGVQYRSRNRVMASISRGSSMIRLGTFEDPMEAHHAWQLAKGDSLDALADRYETERPSCFREDVLKAIRDRADAIRLDALHGRETLNF